MSTVLPQAFNRGFTIKALGRGYCTHLHSTTYTLLRGKAMKAIYIKTTAWPLVYCSTQTGVVYMQYAKIAVATHYS